MGSNYLLTYAKQWALLIGALILGGLSFPGMFWRKDERYMLADNAGLNKKDADGDLSDGIEEAIWRVSEPGRFTHDLKNVGHEWFKSNPKVAFKMVSFIIVCLLTIIGVLVYV